MPPSSVKPKPPVPSVTTKSELTDPSIRSFLRQDERTARIKAAACVSVRGLTTKVTKPEADDPFKNMGETRDWYTSSSQFPSDSEASVMDRSVAMLPTATAPSMVSNSKTTNGSGTPKPGPFASKKDSRAHLFLMTHGHAKRFVLSIAPPAYVDSWVVDKDHTFVVYSEDSSSWNSIGQFIKITRFNTPRRMPLVVDELSGDSQPSVQGAGGNGAGNTRSGTGMSFLGRLFVALALGVLLLWLVAGRLYTFLPSFPHVHWHQRLAPTYYRMANATGAKAKLSIKMMQAFFAHMRRVVDVFQIEANRSIQRHFQTMVHSSLAYLEDLRANLEEI